MSKETHGICTEPDILKFKKDEVQKVINGMGQAFGLHQQAKLMLVGSDGVYITDSHRAEQAFAEGCNPEKDEFDGWWELKRKTWGGDDGVEELDARVILAMLKDCDTHLIVAFKAEDVYTAPKGSSHEGQEFRQGISFDIMPDQFNSEKCDECGGEADEFVQCHDESKKHKTCGAVWCMACYDKGKWYYEDEDALPVADDILVHTDLCPKCDSFRKETTNE